MATKKRSSSKKRSSGKRARSPAQRAATKRMLAANQASRGEKIARKSGKRHGAKRPRRPGKTTKLGRGSVSHRLTALETVVAHNTNDIQQLYNVDLAIVNVVLRNYNHAQTPALPHFSRQINHRAGFIAAAKTVRMLQSASSTGAKQLGSRS